MIGLPGWIEQLGFPSTFCRQEFLIFAFHRMAMENKKKGIDIINEILEDCIIAYPVSSFIISLYKQYGVRGSLSKKQLQGLYGKASKIEGISHGKLGTLEAIIKKNANTIQIRSSRTKATVRERSGNRKNNQPGKAFRQPFC